MTKQRGISLIALIITIIVILLISSITIYTGINMIDKGKEAATIDKLKVIYKAILKDGDKIGLGDEVTNVNQKELTIEDYEILGINTKSYDSRYPVYVSKSVIELENREKNITYLLSTPRKPGSNEYYEYMQIYNKKGISNTTKVEFDESRGVNRPQLSNDMIPIKSVNEVITEVQDIYREEWYNYNTLIANWANAQLEDNLYVWIPRYAYKIQSYYKGIGLPIVPSSAIDIIYLRGITNYMPNGEALPDGYVVHPAFTFEDMELAGIWVSKEKQGLSNTVSDAYISATNRVSNIEGRNSHLMTNKEWGAIAYLSLACNIINEDYTTGNNTGIKGMNSSEIVSAYLNSSSSPNLTINGEGIIGINEKYVDIYNDTSGDFYLDNVLKYGDAVIETSSTTGGNSAWFSSISESPTSQKPFIIRNGETSYFGYESFTGASSGTQYRNVITIDPL